MLRRMDAGGGAGFIGDAVDVKGLTQAPMGQEDRLSSGRVGEERAVVEIKENQQGEKKKEFFPPLCDVQKPLHRLHGMSSSGKAVYSLR